MLSLVQICESFVLNSKEITLVILMENHMEHMITIYKEEQIKNDLYNLHYKCRYDIKSLETNMKKLNKDIKYWTYEIKRLFGSKQRDTNVKWYVEQFTLEYGVEKLFLEDYLSEINNLQKELDILIKIYEYRQKYKYMASIALANNIPLSGNIESHHSVYSDDNHLYYEDNYDNDDHLYYGDNDENIKWKKQFHDKKYGYKKKTYNTKKRNIRKPNIWLRSCLSDF